MALMRRRIGSISVESGRLLIIDPVYLRHWRAGEYRQEEPALLNNYDEACKLTQAEPWHAGMFGGAAVVVAPPDGDDIYPVYGHFTEDGLCAKLDIVLSLEAADWQDVLGWNQGDIEGIFDGRGMLPKAEPGAESYLSGANAAER